ncbi:hypothetical protein E2C01_038690 [Portunus trituberculatus]|uniref:Uncharacterized protein n=1 Tax=Portunus trituberculatus TaxID=210409 RepID=A0A5B7FHM2_PORTR|nr:hypothetical protein [Portunus trituberculatus]
MQGSAVGNLISKPVPCQSLAAERTNIYNHGIAAGVKSDLILRKLGATPCHATPAALTGVVHIERPFFLRFKQSTITSVNHSLWFAAVSLRILLPSLNTRATVFERAGYKAVFPPSVILVRHSDKWAL